VKGQVDVGVEPEGMAVSPDGKLAVNTSETTNMVHWIDTESLQLIDNTLVDQRPRYAVFAKDGKRLWVSAEIGGTVQVIDVPKREIIREISFEIPGIQKDRIQPVGIKLTSDGMYAFVALGPANHVAVIDANTYEVLKYLVVGRRVWHLGLTPDEKLLFTTNGVSGDVTVIDVDDLKAIKSIKVGRYPWGVAIKPSSNVLRD
jgi:PQQ-dependent catabolism-associated beta-propeller protein